MKNIILALILIFFTSCKKTTNQKSKLRKLSNKELLTIYPSLHATKQTIYKDTIGNSIPVDSLDNYFKNENFIFDNYVNEKNELLLCMWRKKTEEDYVLIKQLNDKVRKQEILPIKPKFVNCFDLPTILENVKKSDLENRIGKINVDIDRYNLEIVISIIENCGMPTLKNVKKEHLLAIWLVLQHGDNYHRKKYFHFIEKSVNDGDLDKDCYALMKDRILTNDGKPQIYGTQLFQNQYTDKYELFEIEAPEYVNQRRAEKGLEPINDYLRQWDLKFDVKQLKK